MTPAPTRRMYRRVSAEYPGWYLADGSMQHAVVRDVSLNGFRIEGSADLSRDTIIFVRLWLPDQENSLKIDQAVVRWANEREFGVQIVGLSNEEDLRLANHIERMLEGGPVLATRPLVESRKGGQSNGVGVRIRGRAHGVLR